MSSHRQVEEPTIERASVGDAASLARAAAAMFTQTFGEMNTPENMAAYLEHSFTEAAQRRELEDERTLIWIARTAVAGSIVGYAHLRLGAAPAAGAIAAEQCAEIARLYTERTWHGHGLGAMLMGRCISAARSSGAELLWLGVWERNPRAIAFYEKYGFRAIGEQPFMLGADRQRDVVMALRLDRSD